MTDSVEERVARGAAWLDEVDPEWREFVSTDILNMRDGCFCVLGQMFAADSVDGLGYFAETVGLTPQIKMKMGFNGRDIVELEKAWIAEINREPAS